MKQMNVGKALQGNGRESSCYNMALGMLVCITYAVGGVRAEAYISPL